jgi:hypothetical protein
MKQTAGLIAVAGVAASCVMASAPSASAADSTVTVRPADLAAHTPWAVSPFNTGIAGIGALADPVHFDGSAHLQVTAPGLRAQLAHPMDDALSDIAAKPLSYQIYVDPNGSDPSVEPYGVNLQLQVSAPTFTTLSFQPQLDGGAAAGVWRTFGNLGTAAAWRTSRDFGGFAAGTDHSLADYLHAVPNAHVNASFLNIGTGPSALNAYADNVAIEGTTYNFATAGSARATLTAKPATVERGTPAAIDLSFSSPADGPKITDASAVVTVSGPASLRRRALLLTHDGVPLKLHRTDEGTYATRVDLSGTTLDPGTSLFAHLSVLLSRGAPCGENVVTGRLLSDALPTPLTASRTLTLPCPGTPPTGPGGPGGPGEPGLPPTGAFGISGLIGFSGAATALGLGMVGLGLIRMPLRRRRRAAELG